MTAAATVERNATLHIRYYSTYRQYRVHFNQFCRNAHRKYPYIHGKYIENESKGGNIAVEMIKCLLYSLHVSGHYINASSCLLHISP